MPKFFWDHLEHDINLLSRSTGKSKDETCLVLHMVLIEIASKDPPSCKYYSIELSCLNVPLCFPFSVPLSNMVASGIATYSTLLAKEAREQWEKHFNNAYIQPILMVRVELMDDLWYCLINSLLSATR